jgi:hypothetical protein
MKTPPEKVKRKVSKPEWVARIVHLVSEGNVMSHTIPGHVRTIVSMAMITSESPEAPSAQDLDEYARHIGARVQKLLGKGKKRRVRFYLEAIFEYGPRVRSAPRSKQ